MKTSAYSPWIAGFLSAAVVASLSGCGRAPAPSAASDHNHDHDHDHGDHQSQAKGHDHVHGHEHVPPHGGTPVVLGKEEFHLELVWEEKRQTLTAYVLDGELEKFIRVPTTNFVIQARQSGRDETILFQAVANSATGETVGDTSQFEAPLPWFKTGGSFDGVLAELTVRGHRFSKVEFNFPKGNESH